MTAARNIKMLTRYSRWANHTLLSAIARLSTETIYAKRTAAFGGMIFTLAHIDIVDRIWQAHLQGRPHGFESRTTDTPATLEALTRSISDLGDWYVHYADSATEQSLNEIVQFEFVGGGAGEMTRGDILLHVCNHKTFHRGHLGDMFYQSGLRPPSIDLPVYLRDAHNESELLAS